MSRCHCKCKCKKVCRPVVMEPTYVEPAYVEPACANKGILGAKQGGCSFSCFIILILILLQFNGDRRNSDADCSLEGNCKGIDKGIIFIIALYYLSCCSPCA